MPEKITDIVDEKGRIRIPRGVVPRETQSIKFRLKGKVGLGGGITSEINEELTGNYGWMDDSLEIPEGIRKIHYIREGDVISVELIEFITSTGERKKITA
ncbi:MAG TPA: hypothetical protein EYP60_09005 [bacterium (Candidatus Stahlbacteria)]|nr:hypothetical protein [Candidatus Stahlbacteria bacterium]